MANMKTSKDINGNIVTTGDIVKVLGVAEGLYINMPEDEIPRVKSMLNNELEIEEICERELAWVYKSWPDPDNEAGGCICHGLGLEPHQMKLVNSKNK